MAEFTGETRARVRQRIGRLLFPSADDFQVAALTAATATVLTSESFKLVPDEAYIGKVASLTTGVLAGSTRYINDSAQSAGTVTVNPALGGSPAIGVQVEIWPDYRVPEAINDAIALAVHDASDVVNVYAEATATLDSDRRVITVPAELSKVIGVRWQNTSERWTDLPVVMDPWQDPYSFPSVYLRGGFLYANQPIDADALSVTVRGYRLPAIPDSDDDVLEVRPDYLVFQAAYLLDAGLAYGQAVDPEQHSARANNWFNQAQRIATRMGTKWLPNTVPVET